MADPIKQAIIVNMNVPMGIGRLAAQAAHASWLAVLQLGHVYSKDKEFTIDLIDRPALEEWLKDQFTKVVLRGWGEEMMYELKAKAESLGLATGLMEEEGHVTALAIGPDYSEKIDKVTRELHLL